ncbi:MAG: hypothetical protein WEF86_15380 [Gemmatimonadota bacterium]
MLRERASVRIGVCALIAGATACAAAGGPGSPGSSPPDPAVEARVIGSTRQERRLQVVFDWSMQDRDARFSGRGLLRLDRGERARVDLYGQRGETVAAAVLERDVMRVVPQEAAALLPPPALLWSVLGTFRPPAGAPLVATQADGGETILVYGREDATWQFVFADDVLRSTEWTAGGRRRTVELSGSAGTGLPREAQFRDWTEFRELSLSVVEVEERTAFEADVWILPGER